MTERGLRLPTAGFEVITRILKAYLAASRNQAGTPVKLDDVVRRAGGGRTQVSGQNGFLASIGLIEGGNAKALTDLGRRVALAADHQGQPAWIQAWREVIASSEDLTGIVDSVRVRREMTTDDLLSHIVLTAGVPKTNRSLTGARTVIDVLQSGQAVVEHDGTYEAAPVVEATSDLGPSPATETPDGSGAAAQPDSSELRTGPDTHLTVHVHVWLSEQDLDAESAAKIQTLVETLKQLEA
jgi:hypothetical protein